MKKYILFILLIINSLISFSQGVGPEINPAFISVPVYNDLTAANLAIPNPVRGTMVLLNNPGTMWYYSSGGWKNFATQLGNIIYGGNANGFEVNSTAGYSAIGIRGFNAALLRMGNNYGGQWQLKVPQGNDFIISDWSPSGADRFTIKKLNGFTGINVPNPLFRLDIDGRIRIKSNTESAGLWFNDNTNSAQNTFLGIDPNNNFGIYSSVLNANVFTAKMSNGFIGIGTETPKSSFEVNGSIATKLIKINSNLQITLDQTATVWYFTQNSTISLPDPSTCENRRYTLVNAGLFNLFFGLNPYDNYIGLNGGGNYNFILGQSSIEIISDGTNWLQIK
jgi:hypothetical protein